MAKLQSSIGVAMDFTTTPPSVPTTTVSPSDPVNLDTTDDVTIASGTTVYFHNDSGTNNVSYTFSSTNVDQAPSLTNAGTIYNITDEDADLIGSSEEFLNLNRTSVVTNQASGVIVVYGTGDNSPADFFECDVQTPDVYNAGLIEVVSQQSAAVGAQSDSPVFKFTNTGTLGVWGMGDAGVGVEFGYGGDFSNSGTIYVVGNTPVYPLAEFSAIAVDDPTTFNNSGSIQAISIGDLPSVAVLDGSFNNFVNSGTITADYAFTSEEVDLNSAAGDTTVLTNTGTITGDILPAPATIHNSGTINGNITFAVGNSVYDGANGHLHGSITLGHGTNSVTLGPDGDVVYGGGGADTITGGTGNNIFEIARGDNTIDGGGGFDTLVLASSDMGYTVDLGKGTATGAGVTTLKNIQEVVGSDFGDTLIAGSTAATLVSGSGKSTLEGGAGNDTLIAGTGGDTMRGGGGNNAFIYSTGDHGLTITDFGASGDQNVLKIYGYSSASSVVQQGADTLITLSGTDTILLKNVQASSLTSSNIVYNAAPYAGPTLPLSQAVFGTDPIEFSYDLTIYKGEHVSLTVGETNYFTLPDGGSVVTGFYRDDYSNEATLDNFGAVSVSGDDEYEVDGLFWDQNEVSRGGFINEAGATFTVTNQGGPTYGMIVSSSASWPSQVVNAGTITVTSELGPIGDDAIGIQAGDDTTVINQKGGVLSVTSAGSSVGIFLGGIIENDGNITVTASGVYSSAWGIHSGAVGPTVNSHYTTSSVVNTGTIDAIGLDGATSDGILTAGGAPLHTPTITNSGTITASVAISDSGDAVIANSGTLNGDVDINGVNCSLISNGAINGNILLSNSFIDDGSKTVDLRGGTLSGYISIAPGPVSGTSDTDTIYTGANTTMVKIAGGKSNSTATIAAGAAGHTTVQYDIASTAASWSENTNGSWTVSAGTDGTETLVNVGTLQFTDKTVSLQQTTPSAPNDFNGDGASDILWQNTNGQAAIWTMNGFTQVGGSTVGGNPGANWKVVGSADFNGDGHADILWQNSSNGQVVVWTMNGLDETGSNFIGGAPGAAWKVVATGDFAGNGQADLVFQNAGGQAVIWTMNGTAQTASTFVGGDPGSQWHIVGTGDFNADGKSDLVWQDSDNGQVVVWTMNGTTQTGSYFVGGAPGADWKVVGVGDFAGDGQSDLLFQNSTTGQPVLWTMNGTTQTASTFVGGNPGPSWQIEGVGDYNGDGKADILWQNTNGQAAIWTMNGATQLGGSPVGGNPGTSWHIPTGVG